MPSAGLCDYFSCLSWYDEEHHELMLFKPTNKNIIGRNAYWGSGSGHAEMKYVFTELRQNIILFLAAMNNEL